MIRFLLLLLCCAVVVGSGLIHGHWSGRWHSTRALDEALVRVPEVPLTVGDWQGEDVPVEPQPYAQAGAHAYWMRRYHNAKTGDAVSVILMCGPSGRLAVHTPDVCYQGAGYELVGQTKKITVALGGTGAAEFRTGAFSKDKNPAGSQLRLYWAWSAAGPWQAPDLPRIPFRGEPVLFKLYLIRQFTPGAEAPDSGPAVALLQQLLPELNKTLFSDSPP